MDESVTVTAVHSVAYGREAEFFAWVNSLLLHAETSTDFLGGGLLGPPEAGGEWHVIYRWVDQESAQWWEEVTAQAGWLDHAESFARPIQVQQTTGLRAWIEKRAQAPKPPPKWKMALVTLTAVFPPVLLFNVTLIPRLGGLPVVLRTLVLCIGVTGVVTWVMMPRLQRLLKGWLQAQAPDRSAGSHPLPAIESALRAWDDARRLMTRRPSGRHAATGREQTGREYSGREQWSREEQSIERGARPRWSGDEFDDRQSRPRRTTTHDGRPVLNLVPDGDAARSYARRPQPRDPRSSYLRRETG